MATFLGTGILRQSWFLNIRRFQPIIFRVGDDGLGVLHAVAKAKESERGVLGDGE